MKNFQGGKVLNYLLPVLVYSNTCLKRPLSKRPKIVFQDQLSLNAGQKYCRMLHLSIFEWQLKTGFSVH